MRLSSLIVAAAAGLSTVAKVVVYDLHLTEGVRGPDGFKRDVLLINGKTPGPEIVADQWDEISVRIKNDLSVETTIHFHGVEQKGSIWSDGVPGVTQRMIPEHGGTFVANFTATEHGVFWYHAHSRALFGDGLRGMMYIRPSPRELDDGPWSYISSDPAEITAMKRAHVNPRPLHIIDWAHWTSEEGLEEGERTIFETTCFDSVLVNGKGRVICPTKETFAPLLNKATPKVTPKGCAWRELPPNTPRIVDPSYCTNTSTPFDVTIVPYEDKYVSFAVVNMGASWHFRVSIDDHPMWVYSADGHYHVPQKVDVLEVASGERFQVMVKLDKPWKGDSIIRVASAHPAQFISGFSFLSYDDWLNDKQPRRRNAVISHKLLDANEGNYASLSAHHMPCETDTDASAVPMPEAGPAMDYGGNVLPGFTMLDTITLQAFPPNPPPQAPTVTMIMDMRRFTKITWAMNKTPMMHLMELAEPILYKQATAGVHPALIPAYPVGSIVDMIIINNAAQPRHPIHKHGVRAWVLGAGDGDWTWPDVATAQKARPELFNTVTSSIRDTFFVGDSLQKTAWMVVRYEVHEIGAIFFHCHINAHAFGGMAVALLEGLENGTPKNIPQYYRDWNRMVAERKGGGHIH